MRDSMPPEQDARDLQVSSPKQRDAMIAQVAKIGQRNAARYPQLNSDDLLEDLEADDRARRHPRS